MTIIPMWKTCSKCHRKYSWNPDVGKLWCPYCSSDIIEKTIMRLKKETKLAIGSIKE